MMWDTCCLSVCLSVYVYPSVCLSVSPFVTVCLCVDGAGHLGTAVCARQFRRCVTSLPLTYNEYSISLLCVCCACMEMGNTVYTNRTVVLRKSLSTGCVMFRRNATSSMSSWWQEIRCQWSAVSTGKQTSTLSYLSAASPTVCSKSTCVALRTTSKWLADLTVRRPRRLTC